MRNRYGHRHAGGALGSQASHASGHRDSRVPLAAKVVLSGGAPPPRAAVLNGTSSYIDFDGLAADAYAQTKAATHYVMLLKSAGLDTTFRYWFGISDDATPSKYHAIINQTGAGGSEGRLRTLVVNTSTLLNATGTAATEHIDDAWHMVQSADHYNAGNGDVVVQVDGATREMLGSYLRFAAPTYELCSVGSRRHDGTVDLFVDGVVGYLARIDGEILSQASWTAIHTAFDTGGGRLNTRRVTEAIQGALTTGVCKWAGNLDGSAPHVNTDSIAAPIYNNCTFEAAGY